MSSVHPDSTPTMEAEPVDEERALVPFVPAEAGALVLSRAPEIVIEEGRKAAAALTDVLSKKPKKVMMNGEQYLEFEDWQTLGRFYGVTARAEDPEVVEMGDVRGFRCKAVAIDGSGREISAATAFCLNDEEKWSARPKYEYLICLKNGRKAREADAGPTSEWIWEPGQNGKNRPKKERVQVGSEPVPFFQLASMAQTRACAKVLRNVLAWVVVLAGYKPTPAEELQHTEEKANGTAAAPAPPPPPAEPTRASEKPKDFSATDAAKVVRRCWCKDAKGQHLPAARRTATIARDGKAVDKVYYDCAKADNDPTRCKSVFYPEAS